VVNRTYFSAKEAAHMGDAITDESIEGLGHPKKVFAAFEKLAPVGTECDTVNNRTLL
jgi:hypothetical protein